jgi:hypothetical protein
MLRRFSSGVLLLVALLAVVAPPATAGEPAPKGLEGSFALNGTHGYRVFGVVASTGKGGVLILSVGKKGEGATYVAHGEVSKESVDFDLGDLGRIEVAVQPNGESETLNSGCGGGGKSTTIPAYDYVGTIEFHGEEGFTDAATARTPLRLGPALKVVCPDYTYSETTGNRSRGVRLLARQEGGPWLQVVQNHKGASVLYEAHVTEKSGRVSVARTVRGHIGASALAFAPSLDGATFTAAGPFTGGATYLGRRPPQESRPGKGSWRGNLTVDFPGHAGARLAGPSFSASIVHAHRTESPV